MSKLKKKLEELSDRGALLAFNGASRVFNLLPVSEAYRLGAGLGRLWLALDHRHRKVIEKNLELALGLKAKSPGNRQLQKEIAEHLGCNLCELFMLQSPGGRRLLRENLEISGFEHLEKLAARNSGAIIISAHLGNWELSGMVFQNFSKPVATVGKPIKNKPRLYNAISAGRAKTGYTMLEKSGSAGALARKLKSGGFIALLVDQRVRRRYRIWADFFGYQVPTIPSPAMLARLSGCPIIPAFSHRLRPLHHRIEFMAPIYVPQDGESRLIITAYTNRLNRIIEERIRAHPAQWFWPHDRWRKINSD
jgi:KDO2-lipid IV(A) lauroyltransferase